MRVGFIGLGNMGMPMAGNILKNGFELVVYNRTRSKANQLVERGARSADSLCALTRDVDIVMACLADQTACHDVFMGKDGVLAGVRPGQILVDHSTVEPELSRLFSQESDQREAQFLDAPISGGPEGAEQRTLTIMAGGDEGAFRKALPVLRAIGKNIVYMGSAGSGTITKLANQALVAIHTLAACEVLRLAQTGGVDFEKLTRVLMSSWGASRMLDRNIPRIATGNIGPSNSPLRNLVKDLGIITRVASKAGISLPLAEHAHRINQMAAEEGSALDDIAAICRYLERVEP